MTDLIIITLLIVAIGVTVLQLNNKKTDKKSGGGGINSSDGKQDLK